MPEIRAWRWWHIPALHAKQHAPQAPLCCFAGVRSCADFEYERNIADVNRNISGLESVFILAHPALACVSSSLVRELAAFGHDYSQYIP